MSESRVTVDELKADMRQRYADGERQFLLDAYLYKLYEDSLTAIGHYSSVAERGRKHLKFKSADVYCMERP